MRKFSRHMPAYQNPPVTMIQRICGGIILSILISLVIVIPLSLIFEIGRKSWIAAFLIISGVSYSICHDIISRQQKKLKKIEERQNDDIGTFAKSFDARTIDTWIIRAVYEETSNFTGFAVRADDYFDEDLQFDLEDLEHDLCPIIAQRTGRDYKNFEQNPYYGKVLTVRDLVMFFNAQERLES